MDAVPKNWTWWSGRMHIDDMPGVLAVHHKIFGGQLEEAEIIFRFRRPDGRWIRILSRGVVSCWNDDGTPTIMSGLSIDISHIPMAAPLPEDGALEGVLSDSPDQEREKDSPEPGVTGTDNLRSKNDLRLSALHQLAQMDKSSEEEVLHFAMSSLLQLTDSASGFLYIPEAGTTGGRFFWGQGRFVRKGPAFQILDALPETFAHLPKDEDLLANRSRIVNEGGSSLSYVLFDDALPVTRYIVAVEVEDGRAVCVAGVCNKPSDYDEPDRRQIETLVTNTWLALHRRRYLFELRQAKDAAEAANKAKGEFLANVSHELRTPLNGMLSMLQLMEDSRMTDQQRELLDAAHNSGKALVRIISDILDFSRIDSGKMLLVEEPFDFKASILSGLRLFREEAEKKGLEFVIELDPAIPAVLRGDDTRVRQIVFNLVGNSLKFTTVGGITVTCALEPDPQDGKAVIRITVTDTGTGIPKEKQGALFNVFTQVESFSRKKNTGTGLGLSIVKRLVDMMGGDVRLESEPGKGTSVSCVIVLEPVRYPENGVAIAPSAGRRSQQPLDILVAEDDAVGRFALRTFLLRGGHRAVCVQNGRQALEALQVYPFDCLLTDIQMPDMDGLELVRTIHENKAHEFPPSEEVRSLVREVFPDCPDTPVSVDPAITIVAVSAHTMAGDRERFLQQGINHYIAKPIVMRQLDDILGMVPK